MTSNPFEDLCELRQAARDTSVGTAILMVRRLNIFRREDNPAADLVDAGMDAVGKAIPPVTDGIVNALMIASALAPKQTRERLLERRDAVSRVPHIARIAGLGPDQD